MKRLFIIAMIALAVGIFLLSCIGYDMAKQAIPWRRKQRKRMPQADAQPDE